MQNQPSKLMPAVWGGVLIGVISGVPGLRLINCMCCLGVVGGGYEPNDQSSKLGLRIIIL